MTAMPTRNIDWFEQFIPSVAGRTDRGLRRSSNEDRLMLLPEHRLVAVADGIGGAWGGGRRASAGPPPRLSNFFGGGATPPPTSSKPRCPNHGARGFLCCLVGGAH